MSNRVAGLIAGFIFAMMGTAQAQSPRLLPATTPIRFESWQPPAQFYAGITPAARQVLPAPRDRERHALIGGATGVVVGVAACTVFSTLLDDSADSGVSTCPLSTYLLFGAAGFGLGFAIGWVI
jgi:hypothetical protein